jgi:hypothetical protein
MTETKTKVIAEQAFELSLPYAAGHVLNEAEAKHLNQLRCENIGNNVRAKVQALLAEGKLGEAKALVAEKDAEYVFTMATVGTSQKLDPVEREARSIAKEIVKAKLAEKGLKITAVPDGETKESWAEKIEANIEKFAANESVLKEAKKAVDAKKKRLDNLASMDI